MRRFLPDLMFILHVEPAAVLTSDAALARDAGTRFLNAAPLLRRLRLFSLSLSYVVTLGFRHRLKTLGCMNLDDLSQFDSQLQLSLAAWGYYYEDYIRLSTGIKILQTSRGTRDQDYEIGLVHSLAERRLNEKWSIGEFMRTFQDPNNQQTQLGALLSLST